MSFAIYLVGTLIIVAGLVYGAHLAHVPRPWIIVAALIVLGLGIMAGAKSTRMKDPPSA